jgi:hypothetical protein
MSKGETCSSGCPLPPALPWWIRGSWRVWVFVTWPAQARQLRRAGFRRTGWMTWETGERDG